MVCVVKWGWGSNHEIAKMAAVRNLLLKYLWSTKLLQSDLLLNERLKNFCRSNMGPFVTTIHFNNLWIQLICLITEYLDLLRWNQRISNGLSNLSVSDQSIGRGILQLHQKEKWRYVCVLVEIWAQYLISQSKASIFIHLRADDRTWYFAKEKWR